MVVEAADARQAEVVDKVVEVADAPVVGAAAKAVVEWEAEEAVVVVPVVVGAAGIANSSLLRGAPHWRPAFLSSHSP